MTTTRIAVFGDIHGNIHATEAVLEAIDREQPDQIICLGDLVGYGANPNEVIDAVKQREIPTIMGNYDDGVGSDRDECGCAYTTPEERDRGQQSLIWTREQVTADRKAWLRTLVPDIRREVHGTRIRFVHGSPRRMNEYLFEDRDEASLARIAAIADADVLVFGHTHKPWTRVIDGVTFVNAGSVGKPKDGDPRACFLMLTIDGSNRPTIEFRRVSYDVTAAADAIRSSYGLPDHFAGDIETGGRKAD